MGYVVDADGVKTYLFKLTEGAEAILSMRVGESEKNITLVQITEDRFILERGGEPYYVERESR